MIRCGIRQRVQGPVFADRHVLAGRIDDVEVEVERIVVAQVVFELDSQADDGHPAADSQPADDVFALRGPAQARGAFLVEHRPLASQDGAAQSGVDAFAEGGLEARQPIGPSPALLEGALDQPRDPVIRVGVGRNRPRDGVGRILEGARVECGARDGPHPRGQHEGARGSKRSVQKYSPVWS